MTILKASRNLSLEIQFGRLAIYPYKVDDFCHSGYGPGGGIQKVQRLYGSEVGKYSIYPGYAEDTGAHNNDNGRNNGLTKASGGCNGTVHKG